jgi:hypothetical protein
MTARTSDGICDLRSLIDEQFEFLRKGGMDESEATRSVWAVLAKALANGQLDNATLKSWFGIGLGSSNKMLKSFREAISNGLLTTERAISAFEIGAGRGLARAAKKRDSGVYYTPLWLASLTTHTALRPLLDKADTVDDILALRICDPAAGGGVFAYAVVDLVGEEIRRRCDKITASQSTALALENVMHLVDVDPVATAFTRSLLFTKFGASLGNEEILTRKIVTGDAIAGLPPSRYESAAPLPGKLGREANDRVGALDWALTFGDVFSAGGFDAVLGNPPWGRR